MSILWILPGYQPGSKHQQIDEPSLVVNISVGSLKLLQQDSRLFAIGSAGVIQKQRFSRHGSKGRSKGSGDPAEHTNSFGALYK